MGIFCSKNLKSRSETALLSKGAFRVDNIETSICEKQEVLASRSVGKLSYRTKNLKIGHFGSAPYRVGVNFF